MSAAPTPPVEFSRREITIIMIGLMIGIFLGALDQSILGPALPKIAAELGGGASITWVISAYLLANTAAAPIYGKLSDLYGRKVMMQSAIVIFLATSTLCALATSMAQLIGFRMLQGIGGAGLVTLAFAVTGDITSPRERGKYQAYTSTAFAMSGLLGPVLGGGFADYLSWRWVFWINLPIGLVALVVLELTLRKLVVRHVRHKIDYPGAILIVAAASCVMLVTTLGGQQVPWDSGIIFALAGAAIVLGTLCVIQEHRASEPVLPPRLFHNHSFLIANFTTALCAMSQIGTMMFLPAFAQMLYGVSAADSGFFMIPSLIIGSILSIWIGRKVAASGRYRRYPIIGLAVSAGGALLLSTVTPATPMPVTIGFMLLFFGGSSTVGVMLLSIQNAVEPRDLGAGTASQTFFRNLGASFGIALIGTILIGRLNALVAASPGGAALGPSAGMALLHAGPRALDAVPAALRPGLAIVMSQAFQAVFLTAASIMAIGFAVAVCLREIPLQLSSATVARHEAARQNVAE